MSTAPIEPMTMSEKLTLMSDVVGTIRAQLQTGNLTVPAAIERLDHVAAGLLILARQAGGAE